MARTEHLLCAGICILSALVAVVLVAFLHPGGYLPVLIITACAAGGSLCQSELVP